MTVSTVLYDMNAEVPLAAGHCSLFPSSVSLQSRLITFFPLVVSQTLLHFVIEGRARVRPLRANVSNFSRCIYGSDENGLFRFDAALFLS